MAQVMGFAFAQPILQGYRAELFECVGALGGSVVKPSGEFLRGNTDGLGVFNCYMSNENSA